MPLYANKFLVPLGTSLNTPLVAMLCIYSQSRIPVISPPKPNRYAPSPPTYAAEYDVPDRVCCEPCQPSHLVSQRQDP